MYSKPFISSDKDLRDGARVKLDEKTDAYRTPVVIVITSPSSLIFYKRNYGKIQYTHKCFLRPTSSSLVRIKAVVMSCYENEGKRLTLRLVGYCSC